MLSLFPQLGMTIELAPLQGKEKLSAGDMSGLHPHQISHQFKRRESQMHHQLVQVNTTRASLRQEAHSNAGVGAPGRSKLALRKYLEIYTQLLDWRLVRLSMMAWLHV